MQYLFDQKTEREGRIDETATTLFREHAKTVAEARGEVRREIENVDVACGMANMLREASGNVEDVASDMDEFSVHQPLGVFTAITPFDSRQ